jgi:2-iminobutanoate/2-iminopropanoate deaminase
VRVEADSRLESGRVPVKTDRAPGALGPYSQGITARGFVFTAGQLGIDPSTGSLVEGGIEAETWQVLTNITAILEAAGATAADVVHTTVYIRDMAEFPSMNAVYAAFFPPAEAPPARSAIEASNLPRGARILIDAVARLPAP